MGRRPRRPFRSHPREKGSIPFPAGVKLRVPPRSRFTDVEEMIDHHEHDAGGDAAAATEAPPCPKCQGPMWDNRESKRNPKAPDFKCKDRNCDGVIWPPRTANAGAAAA